MQIQYGYGDNDWRDLLTSYNGKSISYDKIGNPLEVRNSANTLLRQYTWKHGRQLATLSENGTTWNFTYASDGLRTQRTDGQTTYSYIYTGDKLSHMTAGGNQLHFFYDAGGAPMTVIYNGTTYYYVTNLQGDVIAILNGSGAAVVEYAYDAWGNPLSTTGTMAATLGAHNPLRYRSYVFDSETGLYYLQSRYYDPEVGRFINADAFISTGQGLLDNNMFAYCLNNPINYADQNGYEPKEAVDVDGDGIIDYYVYSYTYTVGILFWKKQYTGYVYIFVGKSTDYFEDPSNHPDGFNSETDLLVGDYTSSDNPNMYAYRADLTRKQNRSSILECLLQYDEDFNTAWNRTLESLLVEWKEHKRYAFASDRAKNVDFDNAEEGKDAWYYAKKAWDAVFN